MLACTRIGAPHSVIFGGFAPEAVRDRIHDAESTVLITADGGCRRGGIVPLKKNVDEALQECPDVKHGDRAQAHAARTSTCRPGRDIWWDDFVKDAPAHCPPEKMDAEDMLYLLYTSGSTGKPKGIVHTTGGYLTGVYATTKWVFDLHGHRRVLVHRRHRLGHRPLLRRLRAARQRRDHRDVRGHAGLPRQGPVLADRREARRHHLLHRAHRHPHLHALGRGVSEALRPLEPPPARDRSASRSTRRPGSGTGRSSAAAAARWSTRGGRPRPATS